MSPIVPFAFTFIFFLNLNCLGGQKQENSRLNYFDTDFLRYASEDRKGNVMISPASIKSILAMILEGASGATALEIMSALRLSPNKEEFREQLNFYLSVLQANTTGAYLRNANAVFVSKKYNLKKEYETMLRRIYFTEVVKTDFKDPLHATDVINILVNKCTKGLIPTIIEPVNISPTTDMVLTNALYFKAAWQYAFNPRMTHGSCFYNQGVCRTVAMMELYSELNYAYIDNLRAHAVELPYEGGRYSMILLVPQDRQGVNSVLRDLPYMNLVQISSVLEKTEVMLSLPRFTIDYSEDMVATLRSMRITSLFSSKANLSGIFDGEGPQINNIFHKVHMSVDESGTVAAAATSAMVIPLIESGVQLRVDRPFLVFIRDNYTGLVLFEGKIEEPTSYVEQNGFNGLSSKKNPRNRSNKRTFG